MTAHQLQHALRSLVRNPRISLLAIALFAATIGVTAALFAVVDAVMLRPLAMRTPDRTVIWQRDDARATPVIEAAHTEIDHLAAECDIPGVSAPFFDVVGVAPALGRPLDQRDESGNEPRVAVISDQLWRQRFGANRDVIGAVLRVQEDVESPVRSIEVVGVMPSGFDFPRGRSSRFRRPQVCAHSHSAPARTPEGS